MIEQVTYRLDQFEGPLDLLLSLITKNKVSITDIPISLICDQYMEYIDEAQKEEMHVVFCGDLTIFSEERRKNMEELDKKTSIYSKQLNIAINYGGRNEIVNAVNKLIADGKTHITEQDISENIYFSHSLKRTVDSLAHCREENSGCCGKD